MKLHVESRRGNRSQRFFLTLPALMLCFGGALLWPTFLTGVPAGIGATPKIPAGTTLPISLEHELSSKGLTKGERIGGRLMQDVPLPGGEKIPSGTRLQGSILHVVPAENGGASVTFRLDSLESKSGVIPITVGLRAMASFRAAQSAQAPYDQSPSSGEPSGWATTLQIGGDRRYGSGGKVTNRHGRKVGKATTDGGVLARLEDSPGSPCAGWPDATTPQALWVFSADACGLYDLKGVRVVHPGNKEPLGEITLGREEGEIQIMKSSAMLLRVVK